MTTVREGRRPRRRRSRKAAAARWLAGLLVVAAIFALGVALGQALHDNPRPGGTFTGERTLRPGQLSRP
ncbi:MAG TPA: hypothetical protein VGF21_19175 [Thermoleophilaceae bacterium]